MKIRPLVQSCRNIIGGGAAVVLAVLLGGTSSAAAATGARLSPEKQPENQHFLDALTHADKIHDYHALLAECDRQVASEPEDFETYRRRALARWGARQYDPALADDQRAIELARAHKMPARLIAILYYGRALINREQAVTAAEIADLENAHKTDLDFCDAANDLAWIRATNSDAALRNGKQAVTLATKACFTVPNSVKYLDTLAAAYAESGDAKRAVSAENQAIKAAQMAKKDFADFFPQAQERLALYSKGEKYRE